MEKQEIIEEINLMVPILKKIEECLRNGREDESVNLIKEGLRISKNIILRNKLENMMISLL